MSDQPSQSARGDLVIDRRVNIVSLANLAALIALLITAIGTWYGLVGRVDTLNVRVDSLTKELSDTRSFSISQRQTADNDVREIRGKSENISVRLSVVETQVSSILTTVNRMDQRLESGNSIKK